MSSVVLLAIVEVPFDDRVRCQAHGCGHSVYKRIHVVRNAESLQVLGSDCFSKLFGGVARERPQYGGVEGRLLTTEERALLLSNTAQLLERFKSEQEAALEAQRLAQQLRFQYLPPAPYVPPSVPVSPAPLLTRNAKPVLGSPGNAAWPWMKPFASMGYFRLKDGTGWVRVLRTDQAHVLVPLPSYEGWDEAFPSHVGQLDLECGGYVLLDVVAAVSYLRARSMWDKART